ncbi:hypothetical protein GCM10025771_27860 [Niveibacterium umoris]
MGAKEAARKLCGATRPALGVRMCKRCSAEKAKRQKATQWVSANVRKGMPAGQSP